jgi:hypothetical protein
MIADGWGNHGEKYRKKRVTKPESIAQQICSEAKQRNWSFKMYKTTRKIIEIIQKVLWKKRFHE